MLVLAVSCGFWAVAADDEAIGGVGEDDDWVLGFLEDEG